MGSTALASPMLADRPHPAPARGERSFTPPSSLRPVHRTSRRSLPCRAGSSAARSGRRAWPAALAQLHEGLCAHEVDVGQRAARIGREAEAEDRAHIRLARIGDDALLDGARGFQRLRHEQALLQLLHVEQFGARRCFVCRSFRPGQRRFWPAFRIIVEALAVLAAEPALLLDQRGEQLLLLRHDRRLAQLRLRGLQDLEAEIDADLVVERQRTDRHARLLAGVLDHRRRHALGRA